MPPNKPPLSVVRNGNPQPSPPGIDWKALGLTVAFTTAISVGVTMLAYSMRDRVGRKKNPVPLEPSFSSPFGSAPTMLQGGHFVYVPAGSTQRDANPILPNALRYTPAPANVRPLFAPEDPLVTLMQQNSARLDRIESILHAVTSPADGAVG